MTQLLDLNGRLSNCEQVLFGGPNVNGTPSLVPTLGVTVLSASGAIVITSGDSVITKAGVAALTLAAPAIGSIALGGQDGTKLRIVDVGGHAHTITTPSSGLNGADHIATFAGTVGNFIELLAYNGVWYVLASAGITLS